MVDSPGSILCPLRVVHSYDPAFKVDTYLHEPTWKDFVSFEDVTMEMLALCSRLEPLCNKKYAKFDGGVSETHKVDYESKFEPQARVLIEKMKEQLQLLPNSPSSFEAYFNQSGLATMFPKSASYILNPSNPTFKDQLSPMDNYLSHASILNQVITLSEQLNNDVSNLTNHKYIAHQLAMLYQAVNQISSLSEKYKGPIEETFKSVKKSISTTLKDEEPMLTAEEKQSIFSITANILQDIQSLQSRVVEPMQPVMNFMQQQQQQQPQQPQHQMPYHMQQYPVTGY